MESESFHNLVGIPGGKKAKLSHLFSVKCPRKPLQDIVRQNHGEVSIQKRLSQYWDDELFDSIGLEGNFGEANGSYTSIGSHKRLDSIDNSNRIERKS
nr:hypothetical protein BgiMline_002987 [Biomphalaria glabrata]